MRAYPRSRRTLATVAAAASLFAVSACGTQQGDGASATSHQSQQAQDVSDASLTPGQQVDPGELFARMKAGSEDLTTARMAMSATTSGMSMRAHGVVDFRTTPAEVALTMSVPAMGSEPMRVRLVDGTVYMDMGRLTAGKFVKVDPAELKGELGGGDLLGSMDPMKSLDSLGAGFVKAQYVGSKEVRGETLEHYRLTVDTSKLDSAMKGQGSVALPDTIDLDLWLDGQDRTRRATIDLGRTGTLDVVIGGFGRPVTIQAPPADQIVTMPSMMSHGV